LNKNAAMILIKGIPLIIVDTKHKKATDKKSEKMSEINPSINRLNSTITKMVQEFGFDDVKFISCKQKDKAILLLFKSYKPSKIEIDTKKIGVSEYYPCSNTSHFQLKDLMAKLINDLKIAAALFSATSQETRCIGWFLFHLISGCKILSEVSCTT